jgi:hypothetical protein
MKIIKMVMMVIDKVAGFEGTKPKIIIMEGTRPLTGPALPNLMNAVRMLKSKPLRPGRGTVYGYDCRG